jgi:hypothetical protein
VLEGWQRAFANDADVTPESVASFYRQHEFPVGCHFALLTEPAINLSYHGLPLNLLDSATGAVRVFDYGGNSGVVASAMAKHPRVVESLLIEPRKICAHSPDGAIKSAASETSAICRWRILPRIRLRHASSASAPNCWSTSSMSKAPRERLPRCSLRVALCSSRLRLATRTS